MRILILKLIFVVGLFAQSSTFEKSVKHGFNFFLDNSHISIKDFKFDEKTKFMKVTLFLNGEDKDLTVLVKKFDWGVSRDKQYIVLENFRIAMDIDWIRYIVQAIVTKERGYLKFPYSDELYTLLDNIKSPIKSTYITKSSDLIFTNLDRRYIKINELRFGDRAIKADIWLRGSNENLVVDIPKYRLRTANGRKLIVLQDIEIKEFSKPWIKSIIEYQENEVHINYTKRLFNLLN